MSRSTKRFLIVLAALVVCALVGPNYSSVYVSGPDGTISTQRVSYGFSRVTVNQTVKPGESSVTIEHD